MSLRTFLGLGRNDASRDAWVKERLAAVPSGLSLLDAGAGGGRYRKACAHLRYVSQDFGQYDGLGDGTHIAPHFFATGFSRYWYEHHFDAAGLAIEELVANGDGYDVLQQEIGRLPSMSQSRVGRALMRPLALGAMAALGARRALTRPSNSDLACFGWHCVARRR